MFGLCDSCLEEVVGLTGFVSLTKSFRRSRKPTDECPYCGTTAGKAIQTGLAGCPLCFEALPDVWKKFVSL
ncbi:MAG TPA: hypothetical protein VG944_24110 [Fimbriimonas sp.]|nr:hypothetical protein [Fimbriimonas sp.]